MNETLPKLSLVPNQPFFFELCFATPKEGDSTRPDGSANHWYLFEVKDENEGHYKYFPPTQIARILCLGHKGSQYTVVESATIIDGKPRKVTDIFDGWVDITKARPILPLPREEAPQAPSTAPPVSRTAPPQKAPPTASEAPSQSRTASSAIPHKQALRLSDVANTMEACIFAAGNIAAMWSEEQQQAVAVSMFICLTREHHTFLTREQVKATAAFYAGGIPKDATKHGGEDYDYDNAPPPDEGDVDSSDESAGEEGLPF